MSRENCNLILFVCTKQKRFLFSNYFKLAIQQKCREFNASLIVIAQCTRCPVLVVANLMRPPPSNSKPPPGTTQTPWKSKWDVFWEAQKHWCDLHQIQNIISTQQITIAIVSSSRRLAREMEWLLPLWMDCRLLLGPKIKKRHMYVFIFSKKHFSNYLFISQNESCV